MANTFHQVILARLTLHGLLIEQQRSDNDPPAGTLYSWDRMGPVVSDGQSWFVYDNDGQEIRSGKRPVRLFLPLDGRSRQDALALHARWVRRNWQQGTLSLTDHYAPIRWDDRFLMVLTGVLTIGLIGLVIAGTLIVALTAGILDSSWILLATALAGGTITFGLLIGGCFRMSYLLVMRSNVSSLRFNTRGVLAHRSDGREETAYWTDLEDIAKIGFGNVTLVRIRFRTRLVHWLARPSARTHSIIRAILEHVQPAAIDAAKRSAQRFWWRIGTYWLIAALGITAVRIWGPGIPGADRTLVAAAGMSLFCSAAVLTQFDPLWCRYDKRWIRTIRHHRKRKRRSAERCAEDTS